ncbi:hypothetical protein PCE1_001232 [Barthelona sp. PCE]
MDTIRSRDIPDPKVIVEHLLKKEESHQIFNDLVEVVLRNKKSSKMSLDESVEKALLFGKASASLRNAVNVIVQETRSTSQLSHQAQPIQFLTDAIHRWKTILQQKTIATFNHYDIPVRLRRPISLEIVPQGDRRLCIFQPGSLLELIKSCVNTNVRASGTSLGSISCFNNAPAMSTLRDMFSELSPDNPHYGLNNLFDVKFTARWNVVCEKMLKSGVAETLIQLAKLGIPMGCRAEAWSLILNVDHSKTQIFTDLFDKSRLEPFGMDRILQNDSALLFDSAHYFPFYESYLSLNMVLVRDVEDLVPFRGFSCFAAMVSMMFQNARAAYPLFHAIYTRYFRYLHSVDDKKMSIVQISAIFENLLQREALDLMLHLRRCGVEPIDLVFPWILQGFIGYLKPTELFFLWDRIIAFDDLSLVGILAVVILLYRKERIMQMETQAQIVSVLSNNDHLNIIPLLQDFLFNNDL